MRNRRLVTRLAVVSLICIIAAGCDRRRPWYASPAAGGGHVATAGCGDSRPPSTYDGTELGVTQVLQYAYAAGFHTVAQLEAVVGIGGAESGLVTGTRRWHPEYGCRPSTDVIGVAGPASVWNADHTAQMNSDRGIWQISSHFWPQYSDAQTDDPASAARAMWEISNHGTDFSPWDTYPSPALSLTPSTATVRAFLASR